MDEYETKPDVPCLVCYDLRIPTYPYNESDEFERQRELARELSGYNPFDKRRGLFVEAKLLDATAAAGCLSCGLLKDVWGRLCHTEQLWSGRGDMQGRHGFYLHHLRDTWSHYSTSRVLYIYFKDHLHVIHTMEGESCPWDAIGSLPWSANLPSLDQVRLFFEDAFDHRLSNMLEEHQEPLVLPTRLIMLHDGRPQGDLGPGATLDVRLVETSSIAQTFEDDVRYVALSHCWGSPNVAARMLQTTTETIGAFSQSIPWEDLTKTFKDAMLVTKHLGIRYIWIDSLCIVQGDAQDWAAEASRMASVYANAHLTISAMGAADGDQGLFINTGSEPISRRGVHEIKLPGLQYPIYVRSNKFHASHASTTLGESVHRTEMPLLYRGWAFQERILSPFVLHFTENELIFEDKRGRHSCECKELGHYIPGIRGYDCLSSMVASSLGHSLWYQIVAMYASRLLTSEADRLPAMSGIATFLERQVPAFGSYLAGLWEADILNGLHWYVDGTVQPRLQPTLARGTLQSAPPTWSWASVGSNKISWLNNDARYYYLVEITHATCFPLTSDDKGMVAGGRITLRGRLCPATLDLSPHRWTTNSGRCSISLADESLANDARLIVLQDVRLCSDGEALPAVYFLPLSIRVYREPWWDLFGLVLCRVTKEATAINRVEHSSEDTATFSRIGCANTTIKNTTLTSMDRREAVAWFSEWRDTVFNNFGQEEVLAIV